MKLTMKTLTIIMVGPTVLVILYLVIYNHPIVRWSDLPIVVKILCVPPLAGLAYMVLYLPIGWISKAIKKRRGK